MMIAFRAKNGLGACPGRRASFLATILLAGALLAGNGPALAQQPSPAAMASARELIELKGAANMFDPVVPGVIETAKNTLLQTNTSLAKELNEVAAQLRQEFAARRGEIGAEMARVYAQHFTEAEIKQALTFYKTPLGKKLIEQEPRVLEQSMGQVQVWAERFSDEVMRRFREEMRKKGHTL